LFASTRKHNF